MFKNLKKIKFVRSVKGVVSVSIYGVSCGETAYNLSARAAGLGVWSIWPGMFKNVKNKLAPFIKGFLPINKMIGKRIASLNLLTVKKFAALGKYVVFFGKGVSEKFLSFRKAVYKHTVQAIGWVFGAFKGLFLGHARWQLKVALPFMAILLFYADSWTGVLLYSLLVYPWFGMVVCTWGILRSFLFKDTYEVLPMLALGAFFGVFGWFYIRRSFWPSLDGVPYKLHIYGDAVLTSKGIACGFFMCFLTLAIFFIGFILFSLIPCSRASTWRADFGSYPNRTEREYARSNRAWMWAALFLWYYWNTIMYVYTLSQSAVILSLASQQMRLSLVCMYAVVVFMAFKWATYRTPSHYLSGFRPWFSLKILCKYLITLALTVVVFTLVVWNYVRTRIAGEDLWEQLLRDTHSTLSAGGLWFSTNFIEGLPIVFVVSFFLVSLGVAKCLYRLSFNFSFKNACIVLVVQVAVVALSTVVWYIVCDFIWSGDWIYDSFPLLGGFGDVPRQVVMFVGILYTVMGCFGMGLVLWGLAFFFKPIYKAVLARVPAEFRSDAIFSIAIVVVFQVGLLFGPFLIVVLF